MAGSLDWGMAGKLDRGMVGMYDRLLAGQIEVGDLSRPFRTGADAGNLNACGKTHAS